MIPLLLALAGPARAQALVTLPALDASSPVSVVDGDHALLVPDAGLGTRFVARADLQRAQTPLVLRELDGDRRRLLTGVWQLDLAAAWSWRQLLQVQATAPVVLHYGSDEVDGGSTVGDPGLGAKLSLLGGGPDAVGVALRGGLTVPAGAWQEALGTDGPTGSLGLVIDAQPGPLWLGAVAGVGFRPETVALSVEQDDILDLRLAASLALATATRLSVEAWSRPALAAPWAEASTSPTELLVSGHHQRPGGMRLRAGVGAGLVSGVGTPAWRLVLGVGHGG